MHQALPQAAQDAEPFWSAFDAGTLDLCLLHVRDEKGFKASDAAANCRLAEALLHCGQDEAALECCRRGFPIALDDAPLLHICAWVFSNTGCHEEAAAAYRRLLELRPEWTDGHRHLSGSLAAAGHPDEAIEHAIAACDAAPSDAEYALHAATLLLAAGNQEAAAAFAEDAAAIAADDHRLATDAAELLMQCDRVDDAAGLLAEVAHCADDARPLRVLSAAEMLRGRPQAALAAIDRAVAADPDNAEYHLHRGHILWQLGDLETAAGAFDAAAAIDPARRDVKRARMSLYAASGLLQAATAAGGELLHCFPEDQGSAEAVLHLLNHRLDTIDSDYVTLPGGVERLRSPRPRPGPLDRLRTQRRVIRALVIRETRTRFAEFRLGYGWALIEPILHIGLLSATFAVLGRNSL